MSASYATGLRIHSFGLGTFFNGEFSCILLIQEEAEQVDSFCQTWGKLIVNANALMHSFFSSNSR